MNKSRFFAMTFLMTLGLTQASPAFAVDQRPENVLKVIKSNKDLSDFADLISSSGLEGEFMDKTSMITVFAPNNAAMDKIPSEVMKKAKTEKDGLKSLVRYHAISGSAVFSGNIRGRRASPSSANGEMIGFDGTGKELKVGTATIVTPDLNAMNGVVHVINAPLIPLSLDDKTVEKQKEAQDAERKEMEARMKEREAKMEAERAKNAPKVDAKAEAAKKETTKNEAPAEAKAAKPADVAKPADATAPTAPVAPTSKAVTPPAAPKAEKKEESGGWKKMFGF